MCQDYQGNDGRKVWRSGILAGEHCIVSSKSDCSSPIFEVVIGESFGIDMTYDLNSLFYMYFVGTAACFVWKCSIS